MAIDTRFFLQPGESLDAYRARVTPLGGYGPTQAEVQSTAAQLGTQGTRNVILAPSSPSAASAVTGRVAQDTASSVPSGGDNLINLLRQYQQLGQNVQITGQREQLNRIINPDLSQFAGASPSTLQGVISGRVGAVEPTIGGATDVLNQAKDLITRVQAEADKTRTNARQLINNALTQFGGDAFTNLDPNEVATLEKHAGFPRGYIEQGRQTLKQRDLQTKQQHQAEMDLLREQAASIKAQATAQTQNTAQDNGQALFEGNLVPSQLSGFRGRNEAISQADRLSRKLTGKPYNAIASQLQFDAAKKFIGSLNSSQMTRFFGLAQSVTNTIDEVLRLSEEVGNIGITPLNQVKMTAYVNAFGNTPKGQTVAQYLAAVNTLKEEFANLAQGGYAPTDAVWQLANNQINANYGVKELRASVVEIKKLINFRVGAITGLTPQFGGVQGNLNLPSGQSGNTIRVREKSSGRTGSIPADEFDPSLYNKL